ncbi:unnamed protein product, partial [Ascophyllum nodosum]
GDSASLFLFVYLYLLLIWVEVSSVTPVTLLTTTENVALRNLKNFLLPYFEATLIVDFEYSHNSTFGCREEYREEVRTWRYDFCEKPSPRNEQDVVEQISALCNRNGVVMMLLRPGARLADDRTRGQFLTDLHQ